MYGESGECTLRVCLLTFFMCAPGKASGLMMLAAGWRRIERLVNDIQVINDRVYNRKAFRIYWESLSRVCGVVWWTSWICITCPVHKYTFMCVLLRSFRSRKSFLDWKSYNTGAIAFPCSKCSNNILAQLCVVGGICSRASPHELRGNVFARAPNV